MRYFFFIISIAQLIIFSCNNTENKGIPKNTISFKTGFEATFRFSGSYIEKVERTEYLYFADPMTTKCIKFFKLNGLYVDSVPLKKAIKLLGEINGITVKAKDTIILNSAYTNIMAIINFNGDITKTIFLDSLVNKSEGDYFELSSTFLDHCMLGNSIFFHSEWRYNSKESDPIDRLENMLYFFKKQNDSPYICRISNINSKEMSAKLGLKKFYSNFARENTLTTDAPRFTCINNKLFIHTMYSNQLYIVNPTTLFIEKKINISSRYSKIASEPVKIDETNINFTQEISDSIHATSGQLFGLFYNKNDLKYYLFIYHAVSSTLEKEIGFKKLPFSVLKIDTSFKEFKEYKINSNQYFGAFSIMTTQGLLINKPNNFTNENNIFTTFTRFEF